MCTRTSGERWGFLSLLSSLMVVGAPVASAQTVLHVYGSEGPSPAIHEAAARFMQRHNVTVQVVSGPTEEWHDAAVQDADLIFSSAEFMMSAFIKDEALQVEAATVTPLYMRPSAILVRPDNPKQIKDFPDLLKPGVRVMVVHGSGQTGLWEDMAGKQGDIRTIRAFRRNIVLFAANSTEALRVWDERDDIDAWLTWNIWHRPLRQRATLVPVSDDYVIYRQCNIALTQRGLKQPLAKTFVDFLTSEDGAAIFASWYWVASAPQASSVTVRNDICVVCRIKDDQTRDGVGTALESIRGLLEDYRAMGVARDQVHINAVFHGPATSWLLKDEAYAAFHKSRLENPNKPLIQELVEAGVSLELCAKALKEQGWTDQDVLPGVKIVPCAYPRIVDLELQGYAYLRF